MAITSPTTRAERLTTTRAGRSGRTKSVAPKATAAAKRRPMFRTMSAGPTGSALVEPKQPQLIDRPDRMLVSRTPVNATRRAMAASAPSRGATSRAPATASSATGTARPSSPGLGSPMRSKAEIVEARPRNLATPDQASTMARPSAAVDATGSINSTPARKRTVRRPRRGSGRTPGTPARSSHGSWRRRR